MRDEIRKEVELVEPFDDLESETKAAVLDWIDSGVELCRLRKPATPSKHLVAFSAVVDGEHMLLVDHIDAQLWLPAGGHVEPDEHPRTTALREMKEELDIDGRFLRERPLFVTSTETVGKTAGHTDISIWYAFQGDRKAELAYDPGEFHEVRWFHKDAMPFERVDPHMERFINKLYSLKGDLWATGGQVA